MMLRWLWSGKTRLLDRLAVLERDAADGRAERARLTEKTDLCTAMLAARGLIPVPGDVPAGLRAAMACGAPKVSLETEDGSVIVLLTGKPDEAADVWKAVQQAAACHSGPGVAAFRREPLPPGLLAVASRCGDGATVLAVNANLPPAVQCKAVRELQRDLRVRGRHAAPSDPSVIGRPALTVLGLTIASAVTAAALVAFVPHSPLGLRPVQSAAPAAAPVRHVHRRREHLEFPGPAPMQAPWPGPPLMPAWAPGLRQVAA
jgi:hypothetical protein